MTPDDDLDLTDLRAALDAATPRPDPGLRAAHLRLAQENFNRLQDTAQAARPSPERPQRGVRMGVTRMLSALTTKGALAATTALVAVGFLVLTPAGREVLPGPFERSEVADRAAPEIPAPLGATVPAESQQAATAEIRTAKGNETALVDELARMTEPASDARPAEAPPPPEAPAPAGAALVDRDAATLAPPSAGIAPSAPPPGEAVSDLAWAGLVPPERSLMPAQPNTEAFANAEPNPLRIAAEDPVSTFSIDVDTAAYAVVRQSLLAGALPPPEAVRIEEMVNYFPYDHPAPEAGEGPFRPTVSVMPTPWNPDTRLVTVAIQGERPAQGARRPLNLVFLIDTSGSMEDASKLPLLRQSFRLMLDELRPEDEVAIVTYAGSAGLALPPTPASDRTAILAALEGLSAGGSTNGQGGLEQAYAVAAGMAREEEVSRVVLATDGDFNVGLSDPSALVDYIARQRESGVFLSVLGFGRGNLDDATMQALAQSGNGRAAYIDSLHEAQKVLVDQLTGEVFPIAQDVKVQVEWNPAAVAEYRLIGYETRALRREDFNNDRVDAGELGAGHSVTAIYEVTPVGSPAQMSDPLRYQPQAVAGEGDASELGFLRLRWKAPGGSESELLETPITGTEPAGPEARFAAAVAGWGQLLRGQEEWLGLWAHDEAIALASANRGEDPFGYRTEAVRLMRLSESLAAN